MGTIAIEIDAGRRFETLLETGEGKALIDSIKTIGTSREMAVTCAPPADEQSGTEI